MSLLKAQQLVRLALDPAATREEARTAAYTAVQMIDREKLLTAPQPQRPFPAPTRPQEGVRQLGQGTRRLPEGVGRTPPAQLPDARYFVLDWNFKDEDPQKVKDFAFPQMGRK